MLNGDLFKLLDLHKGIYLSDFKFIKIEWLSQRIPKLYYVSPMCIWQRNAVILSFSILIPCTLLGLRLWFNPLSIMMVVNKDHKKIPYIAVT